MVETNFVTGMIWEVQSSQKLVAVHVNQHLVFIQSLLSYELTNDRLNLLAACPVEWVHDMHILL